MKQEEAAKAVPPFIPGLLVVILLVTISMLIWWRNYVRRTNPRDISGTDDWEYWEGDVVQERAIAKLEKPKLWEVGVGWEDVSEKSFDETGWAKMAPLSATSLTPESPTTETPQPPQPPQASRSRKLSFIPSRFRRPKFLSPTAPVPSSSSVPSGPVPLQVSVLILMPSPEARTRSRSPESLAPSPSLPHPGSASQTGKVFKEEDEDEEGSPDVAFGVVVLPWRKEDEVGQRMIQ